MNQKRSLQERRARRVRRARAKIAGSATRPRLAVFRSNRFVYAQLIDDEKGRTLAAASSGEVETAPKATKTERASLVGELLARKAKEIGVTSAVFDRREYRYHGRVRSVAEGARKGGLKI
jgi:large subunit ribosomal protein L18